VKKRGSPPPFRPKPQKVKKKKKIKIQKYRGKTHNVSKTALNEWFAPFYAFLSIWSRLGCENPPFDPTIFKKYVSLV
jgi:hypothetical protein